MAIEARHMNILSPQFISNRDFVKFEQNMNHGEFNLAAGDTFAENLLAMAAAKANFNKRESGLTYNFNSSTAPPPFTKRQQGNQFGDSDANAQFTFAVKRRSVAFGSSPSLIDAEFLTQIQNQQQTEIDRFVAQETEKLRIEIVVQQRTQTWMLVSTVQNAIAKKLKEKDDELVMIRNLNWVLQERVKNLYVENQIWRDMLKPTKQTLITFVCVAPQVHFTIPWNLALALSREDFCLGMPPSSGKKQRSSYGQPSLH